MPAARASAIPTAFTAFPDARPRGNVRIFNPAQCRRSLCDSRRLR